MLCLLFLRVANAQTPSEKLSVAPPTPRPAANVRLDAWFISQQRKNAAGPIDYFHYKWDDSTDSGFSLFADVFHSFGATTETCIARLR
jgi:hypothetical protein